MRRIRTITWVNRHLTFPVLRGISRLTRGRTLTYDYGIPFHIVYDEKDIFPLTTHLFEGIPLSVPGNSLIQDTVYNDRFKHVAELERLGANIQINGNTATIKGGTKLEGTEIMGSDLRATAALVLAALIADGESTVHRVYHLDRGYEDFENKMAKLGATVIRHSDDEDDDAF